MSTDSKMPDNVVIKYSTLFVGLGIIVFTLLILLVVDKSNNLNIGLSNYLQLFSCGTVTTGLVYTAIALQYNYLSHKERLIFDKDNYEKKEKREDDFLNTKKIELTFEISSEWFKGDMAINVERTRRFLQPFKEGMHQEGKLLEFKQYLEDNESDRKSLIAILNYFENICLLLDRNVIDEECINDAFKSLFCSYYKSLSYYINDIQRDNPRYFKNYTAVVIKLLT